MTQKKIKIVDYSNFDKLFDYFKKNEDFFNRAKTVLKEALEKHPEAPEDAKKPLLQTIEAIEGMQENVEKLEFDIAVQKRMDEIMWHSIDLCNERIKQF